MSDWQPLIDELGRWRDAGRKAPFWLRDDDAIEPTPQLDRFLGVIGENDIPTLLAVIPANTGDPLKERLSKETLVTVGVHGWAHQNNSPPPAKKQELDLSRPRDTVVGELSNGFQKLEGLFGDRMAPILIPPWNRIAPDLIKELPGIGFKAVSSYGPPVDAALPFVNTNVDIIDWRGTRGVRETALLVGEIVGLLQQAFAGGAPIGLLSHHLIHDDGAWTFLEKLFEVSRADASWLSAQQLLEDARAPAA